MNATFDWNHAALNAAEAEFARLYPRQAHSGGEVVMAARKHPGPGSLPTRGVAASVVVAVRLTPAEAATLDAMGPNRGDTIRRLIAEVAYPRRTIIAGPLTDAEADALGRAGVIADRGALEAHRIAAAHPVDPVERARRLAESITKTAEQVRDTVACLKE